MSAVPDPNLPPPLPVPTRPAEGAAGILGWLSNIVAGIGMIAALVVTNERDGIPMEPAELQVTTLIALGLLAVGLGCGFASIIGSVSRKIPALLTRGVIGMLFNAFAGFLALVSFGPSRHEHPTLISAREIQVLFDIPGAGAR